VLGETRGGREAVPLHLDLPPEKRLLVVSGPNAGGKTVVLKTAGLFSLLTQTGIPVPAGPGTRLPVFRSIRTEIGDAQEILSDRSTFSSSMETLASILREAGPDTLALIDEIGGATDPEEGSALAVAFLEAYAERGGRAIVTTHLSAIKTFAAGREDAQVAAMEFDEATGRPRYRLHPGLTGRSRALSVAREQGIPEAVLERARAILGEAWRRRERVEGEAEKALERMREAERDLAREREAARLEAARLGDDRRRFAEERSRMLSEGLAGFDRARQELARRVERELDAARSETARLAQASAARIVEEAVRQAEAEPAVAAAREAEEEISRSVEPGGFARVRGLAAEGRVVSLEGGWANLEMQGKRLRVRRSDLEPARRPPGGKATGRSRGSVTTPEAVSSGPVSEVNVIGQRLDEAVASVEQALDRALLAGAARLRVIHGHGTGRLRQGIREHFRTHPAVGSVRAAEAREGGNGATVLELR
jgi:DNA mismatch repair protein MutS2